MKTKEIKLPDVPFTRKYIKEWEFFLEYELTCLETYNLIRNIEKYNLGTTKYMGIGWFWNYEYRHYLRDSSYVTRQIIHDELVNYDLELDGISEKHHLIITAYSDVE